MVEHVNYSLIILAMLVVLQIWLLLRSRSRLPNNPMPHADTARQRRLTKKKQSQQARARKTPESSTTQNRLRRGSLQSSYPVGMAASRKKYH